MTTPTLNLYNKEKRFTVIVRAHSLKGKTPVFTVSCNGKSGKYRLTSSDRTYYYQFDNGLTATNVSFDVKGDVAMIDNILIVRGDGAGYTDGAHKVTVTGEAASTENPEVEDTFIAVDTTEVKTIDGVSTLISGLQKDHYYRFEVRATNADGSKTSRWSEPIMVFTNESTAVNEAEQRVENAPVTYYTLDGIRIGKPTKSGIYIRREGTHTTKVLVK